MLVNTRDDGGIFSENVFISDLGVRHWRPKYNAVTGQMMRIPGTEPYIPPEIFANGETALDLATDIWAVGCIGFELFTGIHLFEDEFAVERFASRGGEVQQRQHELLEIVKEREPKIYSILSGCLNPDPKRRYTIWRLLGEIGPDNRVP